MKCECCGKNGLNKEDDLCYGCNHVVCDECCYDENGELIAGKHSLKSHKDALEKKEAQKDG